MCFGIDLFVIFFRGYEDVPVVIANPPAIPRPIAWFWGIAANILQAIIVVCLVMTENLIKCELMCNILMSVMFMYIRSEFKCSDY